MKVYVHEFEYLSQLLNARGNRLNTLVSAVELKVGDNVIEAPRTSGTYIVNIQLSNGVNKSLKFMVK